MKIEETDNATTFCHRSINEFRQKADHNKRESLLCYYVTLVATLSVPLLINLGDSPFISKVLPSLFSVLAAGTAGWLQLRKPQQLWALYRTIQRDLEDNYARFKFQIGDYANSETAERLLAERVADISLCAHRKWLPLVPNPDSLQERKKNTGASKQKQ